MNKFASRSRFCVSSTNCTTGGNGCANLPCLIGLPLRSVPRGGARCPKGRFLNLWLHSFGSRHARQHRNLEIHLSKMLCFVCQVRVVAKSPIHGPGFVASPSRVPSFQSNDPRRELRCTCVFSLYLAVAWRLYVW